MSSGDPASCPFTNSRWSKVHQKKITGPAKDGFKLSYLCAREKTRATL